MTPSGFLMGGGLTQMAIDRFQLGANQAIQMLLDWIKEERKVTLVIKGEHVQTFIEGTLLGPDEQYGFFVHKAAGIGIQNSFFPADFNSYERTVSDDPFPMEGLVFRDHDEVARLTLLTKENDESIDVQVASKYIM